MEEEGIALMGRLYREQVEVEERKVVEEEEVEENSAYPREVLDMLARLYNASRGNEKAEREEEKVVLRTSRKLKREENLGKLEVEEKVKEEVEEDDNEEGVKGDDDYKEEEGLENMLGQMYNSSQGMAKALLRVVEEGKVEREKEEKMVEMCLEEEERVYQVIHFLMWSIFHWDPYCSLA